VESSATPDHSGRADGVLGSHAADVAWCLHGTPSVVRGEADARLASAVWHHDRVWIALCVILRGVASGGRTRLSRLFPENVAQITILMTLGATFLV